MVPVANKDKTEKPEHILCSRYESSPLPDFGTTCAVEYILKRIKENVTKGHTKWITNSVTGKEIKLTQVEPFTRSVASCLTKRGMGQGSAALYMTTDVTQIYMLIMGVWRAGGMVHTSYPDDTADMLLLRIQDTKAAWVFCDAKCVAQVKIATAQVNWPVEIFVFGEVSIPETTSVDELFLDDGNSCPIIPPNSGSDDPILVMCTSGTTGRSKGAVYTNKTILEFAFGSKASRWTKEPIMYLNNCSHMTGLFYPIRGACYGSSVVMMHQITKQNIFNCVQTYKPIMAFGFPTYLRFLAVDPEASNYDRSSLVAVCTGGVVIPETFYTELRTLPNLRHVLNGYAMTECALLTSTLDLNNDAYVAVPNPPPLTVGLLFPDSFLKVIDLTTGLTLGPNEPGELYIKSRMMCSGYLNRPDETAKAFVNGWFQTGDIGYYDDQGFIFIVDRIKETFKYYNNHISPAELEETFLKHPAVSEVAVFGIVDPDGGDRIPRAVVVLKPNYKTTTTELQSFANEKLATYKHIRGGVFIVDSLPKGKTGKVDRSAAAQLIPSS